MKVCIELETLSSIPKKCTNKVYKKSAHEIYATFELDGANSPFKTGNTLKLTVNSVISPLPLYVVDGPLGSIKIELTSERKIYRTGQISFANIDIKNIGFSDVHVPIGTISTILLNANQSIDESLIMYDIVSINNFPYFYPVDHLYLFNHEGLGSIIQAGSSFRLRIEMKPKTSEPSSSGLYFYKTNEDDLVKNLIRKNIDFFKFEWMTIENWRTFSNMFINKAELSLNEFFYETVNFLSIQNIKVNSFHELISYHLNRLDNSFFIGSLYNSLDIQLTPAKNSPIYFARSYSARASKRVNTQNSFCTGWTDSLNIKLRYFSDFDVLKLSWNGNEVEVGFKLKENVYFSEDFLIYFNQITAVLYFKKISMVYYYDMVNNCLFEIRAADGSSYKVNCNSKGFVQEITSTESRFRIVFTYSFRNCLTSINKLNEDGSNELVLYTYDILNRLSSTSSPSINEAYDYDARSNLVKVKFNNNEAQFSYGSEDNLVKEAKIYDQLASLLSHFEYEYFNYGPIRVTDKKKNTYKEYLFDLKGRLIRVDRDDGRSYKILNNYEQAETVHVINTEVVEVSRIDEKTGTSSYFNVNGDQASVRQIALGQYEYVDFNGNKIQRFDSKLGNNSEMTEIYFSDGSKETQIKSLKQKKLQIITRNGETLELEYDNGLNRVAYSHATGNPNEKCLYEYFKKDFLKLARSINLADANIEFEYDELDRLRGVKSKFNTKTEYIYDERSNLVEIRINDEFNIKYVYDSGNKLTQVVDMLTNKEITSIEYLDSLIRISNLNEDTLHEIKYEPRNNEIVEYSLKSKVGLDETNFKYEYNEKRLNTFIRKSNKKGKYKSNILAQTFINLNLDIGSHGAVVFTL